MKRPRCAIPAALLLALIAWGPGARAAGPADQAGDCRLSDKPLADDELATLSGRQGLDVVQLSDADQKATISDNSLQAGINGANSIASGSFAGASGIATVIQNSGNHVIIQDSTLVNVFFNQ
ncbi:MAG: hypothetical protein M0017_11765 [Desulfobacteraceae bacterium]|nr:hypothetical protein [Desulfobacteraceae bacterium]